MSTQTNPFYFRRRNFRAASPTIFACYEQVRYEDEDYSDSDSASCSEDDEDYVNAVSHSDEPSHDDDSDGDGLGVGCAPTASGAKRENSVMRDGASGTVDSDDLEMEMEMGEDDGSPDRGSADTQAQQQQQQRDLKGKQRAVDPPEPQPRGSGHRQAKKRRQPTYTLRPILTIQRSQGFVWNQDLFVPPYIKDRYIASTSPPGSRGFISTSASSANSAMTDYEVEVVEIRISEGEIHNIIP